MSRLKEALNDPIWRSHQIGDFYLMDGEPGWKIAYYPIFESGRIVYEHPRALVERPMVKGIDFREVPLHYLTKQ